MTVEKMTVERIKSVIVEAIKHARSLPLLINSEVKIETIKKSQGETYEVDGDYNCRSFLGAVIEKGTFKITLNKQLEILSMEVKPTEEYY
jgi:hypothetical protein